MADQGMMLYLLRMVRWLQVQMALCHIISNNNEGQNEIRRARLLLDLSIWRIRVETAMEMEIRCRLSFIRTRESLSGAHHRLGVPPRPLS
jgi:hypothetical protein